MPTKNATEWFKKSFEFFKKTPGPLVVFLIIEICVLWLGNSIPILRFPIGVILGSMMTAGWLLAIQKAESGGTLIWSDIFLAFNEKSFPIIIYSLVYVFLIFLSLTPLFFTLGAGLIISFIKTQSFMMPTFSISLVIAICLSLLFLVIVLMAIFFALPLIVLKNTELTEAFKLSYQGCMQNMWPLTWFGIIYLALFLLCIPTLGLGVFIVVPIQKIAYYFAYKDIYAQTSQIQ